MNDTLSAESRLIHAGTERVPGGAATPPLVPASIYVSQGIPHPGRGYGRDGNPGWEALEQALGGLEDAEAVAFASDRRPRSWTTPWPPGCSSGGGIPGPFEAWLALRGLKTLPLRMARQSASALAIAGHLAGHPRVTAVHYPGVNGFGVDTTTSELARRQMPDGFGPQPASAGSNRPGNGVPGGRPRSPRPA
jgi:cystathionine beta-lyase/cystathionine gamma-synthase